MAVREPGRDDLSVANLAGLIERCRIAEGLTYAQLADRSGRLTKSRVHQLASRPLKNFPDPPTIEGLSAALGLSVTVVVLACARSLGLAVRQPSGVAELLPEGIDDLPEAQIWAVLTLLRALIQTNRDQAASVIDPLEARPDVDRPGLEATEAAAALIRETSEKAQAWDQLHGSDADADGDAEPSPDHPESAPDQGRSRR